MPKNILIFADGTGQAGGIAFDEDRTNIYKLYRATRCGPDSSVDPSEQVAFYDPGLGSPADGGFMWGRFGRWLYNMASQATGLGLTENVIDCYAALIRLYEKDDRVFLFGFSRGAYTARCLGGVISMCRIPRHLPGDQPLPLDPPGARSLAIKAVRDVYQFCSSQPRTKTRSYRNFMLGTRDLIAKRFRDEHGSAGPSEKEKANVYPYFIGVFDTVAALGRRAAKIGLVIVLALVVSVVAVIVFAGLFFLTWLFGITAATPYLGEYLQHLTYWNVLIAMSVILAGLGVLAWARNYIKFDFNVPGYGFFENLATFHFAYPKQKFYDNRLDPNVRYAKHAISIDENRKDFARVPWIYTGPRAGNKRDDYDNIYFEQVWFAGVHADVGGGYPENESRLSDITLKWMLAAASIIPHGIKHDERVLSLYADPAGLQHDERKAGRWQWGGRVLPVDKKTGICEATMHPSVYSRFEADPVVHYDSRSRYCPANMREHIDFKHYYEGGAAPQTRRAIADNIEHKWGEQKRRQALDARNKPA